MLAAARAAQFKYMHCLHCRLRRSGRGRPEWVVLPRTFHSRRRGCAVRLVAAESVGLLQCFSSELTLPHSTTHTHPVCTRRRFSAHFTLTLLLILTSDEGERERGIVDRPLSWLQREIQRLVSSRVREGRYVCPVCASVTRELWMSVKLGL